MLFTGTYRAQLLASWCEGCLARDVPASRPFALPAVLSSPVELLEWSCQGLPTDTVSYLVLVLVVLTARSMHPAF